MLRKQILIALGMLAAMAACIAGWRLGLGHGPAADPGTAERLALAVRWIVDFADARKGTPMKDALASEIMEA